MAFPAADLPFDYVKYMAVNHIASSFNLIGHIPGTGFLTACIVMTSKKATTRNIIVFSL